MPGAVDLNELGSQILRLDADIADRAAEQLLRADFTDFSVSRKKHLVPLPGALNQRNATS